MPQQLGVPVLFHLPSARGEANLHHRLAEVGPQAIIATTTAELRAATGASPAEQVWQLSGFGAGRHRLIDLPYTDTAHDAEFPNLAEPGPGRAA